MITTRMGMTLGLLAVGCAWAGAPDGLEIFKRLDAANSGYGDQVSEVRMVLKDAAGSATERKLRIRTLESQKAGNRTVLTFEDPPDIRGTALLTHEGKAGANDAWIYLPAFHRVKRIAEGNMSTPFVASEFSYEDINGLNLQVSKFTYRYVKADTLDKVPCSVVERIPSGIVSAYARQLAWVDSSGRKLLKVEAFKPGAGGPAKVFLFKDYAQYPGGYWRPGQVAAENRENGKVTSLYFSGYRFKNGFRESQFDENALGK